MSRKKEGEPKRSPSIPLPPWWLEVIQRQCSGKRKQDVADELNRVARPEVDFTESRVKDFLAGKVTPRELIDAFLLLFPDLPPPVFWANSYHDADQVRRQPERLRKPVTKTKADAPIEFAKGTQRSGPAATKTAQGSQRLTKALGDHDEELAKTTGGTTVARDETRPRAPK